MEGARGAALLYSLIQSCRLAGIDPFAYLREMLPALFAMGEKPTTEHMLDWLPDRWLLRRATATSSPPAEAG